VEPNSGAPLREMWYLATPSAALRRGRLRATTLLGEPIVLGRDAEGRAFALRDICPHRGIPLSYGRIDRGEVECCYHGWRFAADGHCTAIPSLVPGQELDIARIRVQSYPVEERQGLIWVYFGDDPAAAPELPVFPDVGERAPDIVKTMRFDCTFDAAVVGLMDPVHGPFVHRSWWWRTQRSMHEKEKAFAPSPWGFTMLRHRVSSNSYAYKLLGGTPETEIAFRLPSTRIEHIRIGRHAVVNLTALTPVGDRQCEITNALYWTIPWLTPLKPLLLPFVRAFLRQDRDIMARQQQGLRHDPPLMLINDADTQAKWYHRLKNEYARARSEGRAFVNPVKDRVLRWRS